MVDFGLGLMHGPPAGQLDKFIADLDATLPLLQGKFRSLWMTDHFMWEGQPTFEAWTTLAFIAARYPDFEVGPMVLGQSYRNPALLAFKSATLQVMSGGRFVMGIGAGWKEDEYRAYNYPYPSPSARVQQLEETLIILKQMWTQPGTVSYEGQHYRVTDAWCEPKPEPMIPILVGGGGYTTMKHAAQYADIWNLPDAPLERYMERATILRRHLEAIERDPASLQLSWFGRIAVGATEAEARARGLSRENKWTPENAFVGTPPQLVEQLSAFIEQGCDYFMVDIIDAPNEDVIGMVVEDMIPHLPQ